MCSPYILSFVDAALPHDAIHGKTVLEVGSYNVNGSVRDVLAKHFPQEYVGVDLSACDHDSEHCPKPCVDEVCDANNLGKFCAAGRFDVVVSTEFLEHSQHWQKAVHGMKHVLKPGGLLVLTTRSPGFPLHCHPSDYHRFTYNDFRAIFSDMDGITLQDDPECPGVFIRCRKPPDFEECDLAGYEVYSMTGNAPYYYVAARLTGQARLETAVRTFRLASHAGELMERLNRAVGWRAFGVVKAEPVEDGKMYNANWER